MKLGSFSRLAFLGLYLSLASLVVSCGKGKVTSKDISIEFSFPLDGDRVTSSDDRNDATPDVIEIDVVVRVVGLEDGETVNLSNDIDVSGGTPREISGTVAAGVVQFPSYALPTADEEIVVTLRAALPSVAQSEECDRTNCDEARINVVRRVCEFNTPPSGGPTLTAEDPAYVDATDPFDPFEIDVIADCVGGSAGDFVALTVNGGAAVTATEDAAGRVTYSRVALREGGNDLRVVPVQDAAGQTPTGAETQLTVDVDTGACTAWIEPLDRSRLLADFDADADPSTGMQATRLDLVTDCADTARVDLFVSTPGPTVCDGHADPTTCEGDAYCSWSGGEQACLPDCSLATNRVGCATLGGCSWSVGGGGTCVRWREVTSMCDRFADSGSCEADAICNWDNGECLPDCAASGTRGACEEQGGCLWSTAGGGQCLLATPQTLSDPAGARFRVTGVKLPTSIDPFDVAVAGIVDDGTQTGTAVPVSYWVDPEPPRIVSALPGDGACLGALQDLYGTPADGIQIDAFGLLTGAGDGAEVWLTVGSETCATSANCTGPLACGHGVCAPACATDSECDAPLVCRDSVCRRVGTVSGGTVVISEVDLPVGLVTMSYVGLDLAGNETAPTLSGVSVFDIAPTVAISDPTDNVVLGSGADADTQLAGLQYEVQVDVTDVAAGTAGTLVISGQAPVSFTPPAGAGGTAAIPVSLVDGVHTMRARVQDPCGNTVESPAITVTVAADLPDLLVVAYTDFANRGSVTDGSTVNVSSVDLDIVAGTSLGGVDRAVSVTAYPAIDTSGGDRQCSGTPVTGPGGTMPAADEGLLVSGVPLAPGDNCLEISVDDGVNSRSATFVLVVRDAVPAVEIAAPSSGGLNVATDDSNGSLPGFNTSVVVNLSGGPGTGGANDIDGTLELRISSGGTLYNSLAIPAPANTTPVSFVDASLPTGDVELVVAYLDGFGNVSTSAPVSLTITASGPAVVVASPADGSHAQSAGFSIDVALTGGTAPDSCQLFVDGAADVSSTSWQTLTPSPLGEGSHTFRADCTNGDGTTSTQTIAVDIDDTPPVAPVLVNEPADAPGRLVFDQAQAWINAMVPDQSSAAGFQHSISGLVPTSGQAPIGWTVELTATPQSGSPSVYTRVLTSGGDPTLVVFDGVELGTAEEEITFSLTVTDAAGNVSATTSATLTKDFTPPEVTQTVPLPDTPTLARANDVDVNPTYVDVAFSYTVTGASASNVASLMIDPTPANLQSTDLPLQQPVGGGALTFPTVAFADGDYVASLVVADDAGNLRQVSYNFGVQGSTARITWARPAGPRVYNLSDDQDPARPGVQEHFAFNVVGFNPGPQTELKLCSTLDPVGGSEACRWGSDGTQEPTAPDKGVVIARGFLTGSADGSSVFLSNVSLADGQQVVHAEAVEAGQVQDTFSEFFDFTVDSQAPVITAISFDQNNSTNDDIGASLTRLNPTEGSASGGRLSTAVTVSVTGAEAGQLVELVSDRPAAGTVVGSGPVDGAGQASFSASILEGAQVLTGKVSDVAGNTNDPIGAGEPTPQIVVDLTPGAVTLPGAAFTPYTASPSHGLVNDAGTPGNQTDDTLDITLVLPVSDNESLDGASVTLRRYDTPSGGTALDTVVQPLAAIDTAVTFDGFGLAAGLNYLEAEIADAAGNVTVSPREVYGADFYGPTLTLEVRTAAGTFPDCTSEGSPCAADILDPTLNNNRAVLDPPDADGFRPGGTDLVFGLSGCQNSDPAIEDCASKPITVRLESRIAGSGGPFLRVDQSTYGETGDVSAQTSYLSKAPSYALDPGLVRELRVYAQDGNQNTAVSGSVFLQLNVDGVLIEVERLNAGVATGELLADDRYWGAAENEGTTSVFSTGLRVHVTVVGSQVPTDVDIVSQPRNQSYNELVGNDFSSVDFELSPTAASLSPNDLTVTVNCTGGQCGTRTYSSIIADIVAPVYQFHRCDLCALGVPLVNDALCATCDAVDAEADANIADPASAVAVWNAAGDQDGNPTNGFSILEAGTPLRVKLLDVEDGQIVTLSTDQPGGLTGATALSSGCPTAATCMATFGALGVPTVAGSGRHRISVSFTDRAGNPAAPDPIRDPGLAGAESITAVTDVDPPAGCAPTVCIGESTTPAVVSPPSSDPTTYEEPSCAAECASGSCDRRGGEVMLTWQAPADDGSTGPSVQSYDVVVAALGISYGGVPAYVSCGAVDPDGAVEQLLTGIAATALPGDIERLPVSGLYPHRSYCFGVLAVDDVGNRTPLASSVSERTLPLVSFPDIVPFDPVSRQDDASGAEFYTDPNSGLYFSYRMINVGDMDGDGRDDLAVSRLNTSSGSPPTAVSLFLTASGPTAPAVVIAAPGSTAAFGGMFGNALAGGDFDGDGLADLAICANSVAAGGANGGAAYVYWGVEGQGIRRDTNLTDDRLPSPFPDVALLGPANARLCSTVTFGDIDGSNGDELIVATSSTGQVGGVADPKVYGFRGGDRNRFPTSPPLTAVITLNLEASIVGGGFADRADVAVVPRDDGNAQTFPTTVVTADVDGDGAQELIVSDHLAPHAAGTCVDCGEVYVYHGGAALVGQIAPPNTDPPPQQLLHTLRFASGRRYFGQTIARIPQPLGVTDSADWLAVQSASGSAEAVVIFKGTSLGVSPGIVPPDYPIDGRALGEYVLLDATAWDGSVISSFGNVLVSVGDLDGDGGVDLFSGPAGAAGAMPSALYSFNVGTERFEKLVVFQGEAGFATAAAGLSGFLDAGVAQSPQLVLGSFLADTLILFH